MKDTVGQSPFNVGGEWSWPQAFGVQVEGETAVIRVSLPDNEPVELRALMLIEESTAKVLKHAISRVRIEFVGPKNRGPAEHAALRLGLFSDDVRSRFELRHDGRIIPIVDVVSDLLDLPLDLELPPESFTGNGFAPFGRALDAVLKRISSASEGTDEIEGAPISVVSRGSRPHPRLRWPLSRLSPAVRDMISTSHVQPTRGGWIGTMERRLNQFRLEVGSAPGLQGEREYPWILDQTRERESIWTNVRAGLTDRDRRLLHSAVANLKSSQAFALNVLGGLQTAKLLVPALAHDFPDLVQAQVEFEVFDEGTREFLGEKDHEHQTQIDALITMTMADRSVLGLVVEVKLTERSFGGCRGPRSEDNEQRQVCTGYAEHRPTSCFLKVKHGRRYLDHLDLLPAPFTATYAVADGCPLHSDGYQLARNLLLTRYLRKAKALMGKPRRFDDSRMAVLCLEQTGALVRNGPKLLQLGIQILDAKRLVAAARLGADGSDTVQADLFHFLDRRYPGMW